MTDWPADDAGRPLAQVFIKCAEKVPTIPFGNIEFGGSITRYVIDTPEGRKAGMDASMAELKAHLGVERALVYELRQKLGDG